MIDYVVQKKHPKQSTVIEQVNTAEMTVSEKFKLYREKPKGHKDYVRSHVVEILELEAAEHVPPALVLSLLSLLKNTDNPALFTAVIIWGQKQIRYTTEQKLPVVASLLEIVRGPLKLLNILSYSPVVISELVAPKRVFTAHELVALFEYTAALYEYETTTPTTPTTTTTTTTPPTQKEDSKDTTEAEAVDATTTTTTTTTTTATPPAIPEILVAIFGQVTQTVPREERITYTFGAAAVSPHVVPVTSQKKTFSFGSTGRGRGRGRGGRGRGRGRGGRGRGRGRGGRGRGRGRGRGNF
jgi:hypothetical protein